MEPESYYMDDPDDEIFWPSDQPPPIITESSFVPYTKPSSWFSPLANLSLIKRRNVHKRMIDFLISVTANERRLEFEKDRSYKHMINERLRREKQRYTYNALHSLLPPGTRGDKYTILQMAALNLRELKNLKENLHKRNQQLENNVLTTRETNTFRIWRQTPLPGIDSIIGVLTTMKNMGLKATSIQSEFSNAEFSAVLEIRPKTEAVMVENAVTGALEELEKKFVYDRGVVHLGRPYLPALEF